MARNVAETESNFSFIGGVMSGGIGEISTGRYEMKRPIATGALLPNLAQIGFLRDKSSCLMLADKSLACTPLIPIQSTFMSDIALAKGEKFLEDNAKKEGVQVTASGLQYLVLTEGTGKSPKATDTVEVHYEGTLITGTVFDSSYQRKESIEFPLNRVIAGWTEGVQLMKEGAKFRFFIPSKLAYGSRGAGRDIGPNEALIFVVELIKVK